MNILYIDHYAGSPEMGMEFRPYYLAKEWIKMGHTVRIVAGDYSHLRIHNPEVKEDFQEDSIDGITYTWLKTGSYEGNGVSRALTMFRFVCKLRKKASWIANHWGPDVIITSSTYPLDTYAGQKIKKCLRKHRKKEALLIHEVHDMWPSTLYEVGGMSKWHPYVRLIQIAENSAYSHCDYCVSLLPYSQGYMVEHGLESGKFVNIQNGVVKTEWENYQDISEEHKLFFDEHKEKFIVGYFGGHSISNALDMSLDVAKKFLSEDARVEFVFVGDGIEKGRLVRRVQNERINNVFFLPPVNKKSVPHLLQHFDCCYMTGISSPLYRFGLCLNKMYDSMMAGLPIICAFDAPDTLVKKYNCGLQCNPEDVEMVVNCIKRIVNMSPEERKKMGKNGKDAILAHYTYEKLAVRFAELFEGARRNKT